MPAIPRDVLSRTAADLDTWHLTRAPFWSMSDLSGHFSVAWVSWVAVRDELLYERHVEYGSIVTVG